MFLCLTKQLTVGMLAFVLLPFVVLRLDCAECRVLSVGPALSLQLIMTCQGHASTLCRQKGRVVALVQLSRIVEGELLQYSLVTARNDCRIAFCKACLEKPGPLIRKWSMLRMKASKPYAN